VLCVQRLSACARLDESAPPLAQARAEAAAGDESWAQWVAEYQRGTALILRLDLSVAYLDGEPGEIRSSIGGLFVESDIHPPKVEQQIAELASGVLMELVGALAARGAQIDAYELGEMYVHVELEQDVRQKLEAAVHHPRAETSRIEDLSARPRA
jgi:hypothetical protein